MRRQNRLCHLVVLLMLLPILPLPLLHLHGYHLQAEQNDSVLTKARAAYARGDYHTAEEEFALAFQAGRSFAAGMGLTETLLKLDRWSEAQEVALKTMRLQSTSAAATALYAETLFRGGRLNDAGVQYLRALNFDLHQPRALIGLAKLKLSRAETEEALGYLRDAIAAQPDTAIAYYWFGVAQERQGWYATAAAAYEKFLSYQTSGYPEALLAAGLTSRIALLRSFGQTTPLVLGGVAATTVKLDLSQQLPIVEVRVNDVPARFLINTALPEQFVISAALAQKAGLQPIAVAGATPVYAQLEQLRFGALAVRHIPVRVLEPKAALLPRNADKLARVDGMMNLTWLRSSVVTIDYRAGTMQLSAPALSDSTQRLIAPTVVTQGAEVSLRLPLQLIQDRAVLAGEINDEARALLLDLSDPALLVSAQYAISQKLATGQKPAGAASAVVSSLVLDFGGQQIQTPELQVSTALDEQLSRPAGVQFTLALGQSFLRNLNRLSLDFANMTVTFDVAAAKPAGKAAP